MNKHNCLSGILAIIICITILFTIIGCNSKSNEFNDPNSLMYYNKTILNDKEISVVENKYKNEGYSCAWDINGYLTLGKLNDTEDIVQVSSFSRYWPPIYENLGLIPSPLVFESAEGPCEYIRGNIVYLMDELSREYLYVKWTKEQAKEYTEFIKQTGFNIDTKNENEYVKYDYYFSGYNSKGVYIAVQYIYNHDQKGIGYIMIEIPNETEEA